MQPFQPLPEMKPAQPQKMPAVPDKLHFSKSASALNKVMGPMKTAGLPKNVTLGAVLGVLFGKLVDNTPVLSAAVAGGTPRDALIGALAAAIVGHEADTKAAVPTPDPTRPDAPLAPLV